MQTRASVWLNCSGRTMPDFVTRCATLPRNGVNSPLTPRPVVETLLPEFAYIIPGISCIRAQMGPPQVPAPFLDLEKN